MSRRGLHDGVQLGGVNIGRPTQGMRPQGSPGSPPAYLRLFPSARLKARPTVVDSAGMGEPIEKVHLAALRSVEAEFYTLQRDLDFFRHLLNPTNLAEERSRFWLESEAGRPYDPQYRYEPVPATQLRARDTLQSRLPVLVERVGGVNCEPLTGLLTETLSVDMGWLDLLGAARDAHLAKSLMALYGLPTVSEVDEASRVLRVEPPGPEDQGTAYSSQEFASLVRSELRSRALHWDVVLAAGMGARFSVLSMQRLVKVNTEAVFGQADWRRFVAHEVDTHIARAENGRRQPLRMFETGVGEYLATEEGLATLVEDERGVMSTAQLRRYAGRLLAASMAETSFSQIVDRLRMDFEPADCYEIAHRVKRGLSDTAEPGGFTKDLVYLRGRMQLRAYRREGGDLGILFVGKVGLQHVPALQPLIASRVLSEPSYVPFTGEGVPP
jgi:uncharacterized protein (TIGR02421 family)